MEVVAVERELGSGQGDIMTRTPNVTRYEKIDHLQDFFENLVLLIMRYSNLLAIRSSFYYSFIIEHHEVIAPNAHSVLFTAKRKYWRKR